MKDYDSKVETLTAWHAGADFLIKNFYHAYHGKPMSIHNIDTLLAEGFTHVELRYHKMQRCIFIDIRKASWADKAEQAQQSKPLCG